MQVIGGGGTLLGGGGPRSVLVNDDAAEAWDAMGNPQGVRDAYLQFTRNRRRWILDLHDLAGATRCSGEPDYAQDDRRPGEELYPHPRLRPSSMHDQQFPDMHVCSSTKG